jgi:5-methyltetrahydrofolate--homocysteine methyltransferase
MDSLQDPEKRPAFVRELIEDAKNDKFLQTNTGKDVAKGSEDTRRSDVAQDHAIPTPPFWGVKVLRDIPLDEVFRLLDLDELYRLQWGARGSGPEFEKVVREELEPTRKRLEADALKNGWLRPQAVYGYFPVQSTGNELVVYDAVKYAASGETVEVARFRFPRMEGRERLCLADYYRSVESGEVDVAAVQVVTVGTKADEKFADLQGRNEYTEAFFVHGLSVETAEAVAEWMHQHEKSELRIPPGRGKRYSWGYPACPDLDDHQIVFRLLPAEQELGMSLSAAFQLMPEQSTAALVTHHPQAKYYAVRANAS